MSTQRTLSVKINPNDLFRIEVTFEDCFGSCRKVVEVYLVEDDECPLRTVVGDRPLDEVIREVMEATST